MAILTKNKQQREEEPQTQDEIDAVFEKTMQRKLNSLVRNVVNDFTVLYASTGQIVDTNNYSDELQTILKQTYRRVNREFSNVYLEDLEEAQAKAKTEPTKQKYDELIKIRNEAEPAILASLLVWSQTTAPKQSSFVTNTWDKIIRKNVDDSIAESILEDLPTDDIAIATKTKKPLTDELLTHNEVIAMQEVQTATENAKFTEVDDFNKELKKNAIVETIDKVWVTMGDLNVRDAHRFANGQRRDLKDAFLVGGELLMYPKDSSLGASMGNIINCRCKSIYM